jgi:hypothetical protein
MTVVVAFEPTQHGFGVSPVDDQEAAEEFAADRPDEAFGDRVRSRLPHRRPDDSDVDGGEDGIEGDGELAIAISDEEPEAGIGVVETDEQVAGLLAQPGAGRVGGNTQDVHPTAGVFDDEERVEPPSWEAISDRRHERSSRGMSLVVSAYAAGAAVLAPVAAALLVAVGRGWTFLLLAIGLGVLTRRHDLAVARLQPEPELARAVLVDLELPGHHASGRQSIMPMIAHRTGPRRPPPRRNARAMSVRYRRASDGQPRSPWPPATRR